MAETSIEWVKNPDGSQGRTKRDVDAIIVELLAEGRLRTDHVSGLVYALKSNTPHKSIGTLTKKGYLRACVNYRGKQVHVMVHRVIWVAVHGPLPAGYHIDHGRLGKTNNSLPNLEAVTGPENMRRASRDGCLIGAGRKDGIRDAKGRFGKKAAGRLPDGRTWDGMPEVRSCG